MQLWSIKPECKPMKNSLFHCFIVSLLNRSAISKCKRAEQSSNRAIERGFTLIELLIVVAIIGVLASLLMVNFIAIRQRARDGERKSHLRQIQSALELHRADNPTGYPLGTNNTLAPNCPGSGTKVSFGDSTCSTIYINPVPKDPLESGAYNNANYFYNSNTATYTLAACLENASDAQGIDVSPGGNGTCESGTYFVLVNP